MRRVLLVDGDSPRSAANRIALTTAGHDVTVAPSGAFALTMLERARPDVIVSWTVLEDMPAYELCAIVRSDPMTRAIPFIVLTDRCASSPDTLAQAVAELPLAEDVSAPCASGDDAAHDGRGPRGDPHAAKEPALSPTDPDKLATADLGEAFQGIHEGKKTGRLVACVGAAEGTLLFRAGRLVDAQFQGQRGELAVASLLVMATNNPDGRYHFRPWDGSEVPRGPWTVDPDAEQLLLRTWAESGPARSGESG